MDLPTNGHNLVGIPRANASLNNALVPRVLASTDMHAREHGLHSERCAPRITGKLYLKQHMLLLRNPRDLIRIDEAPDAERREDDWHPEGCCKEKELEVRH